MQLIDNWLKGNRNFFVGRSLYKTFGTDDEFKKQLECGGTEQNKSRLLAELEKLNQKQSSPKSVKVPEAKPELKSIAPIAEGFDDISDSLEKEWKTYFSEMKLWQHKLDEYGEDNSQLVRDACFDICKKIKRLEQLMMKAVETYDYYKLNGRLPDSPEKKFVLPTDPVKLANLISSCARQIRRYRYAQEPEHIQLLVDYKAKYKLATGKDYEYKN
jgi:hypothetical protein